MATDIANDVHEALTGRKFHDDSSSAHPDFFTPITRGPMKDRTFNIPDHKIEDFLESNVREVGERYARTMAAERAYAPLRPRRHARSVYGDRPPIP